MICEQKFIEDIQQICDFSLKLCKNPWIIKNLNNRKWMEMNDFVCDISGKKYKRCCSICYSEAYSVPVFWFNIYNFGKFNYSKLKLIFLLFLNGKLIPLEDFKNFTFRKETNEFLEFISQGEHPFLGIAFYNIHPCKTAELMQNFKGKNYVLW
ncbi:unnamed protein product [Meloidogyne enterolobii]|uniref:Uncharacterized protein n=1 Tax=Meloidogyne enterolobii TaxID=390850 RepID=A0ACB0ZYT1_MELEN